jgi:hypothetical protein
MTLNALARTAPRLQNAFRIATQDAIDNWVARVEANGGTYDSVDLLGVRVLAEAVLGAGLTDAAVRLNPFAGRDLSAALVPLFRGGGPDVDTNNGFVAGDYSRPTGITGDGSSYLDTGVQVQAFPPDSRALSVYRTSAPGSDSADIGAAADTNPWYIGITAPNTTFYQCFVGGGVPPAYSPLSTGLITGVNQPGFPSGTGLLYEGTTLRASETGGTESFPLNVFVHGFNDDGVAASLSTHGLGMYSIGPGSALWPVLSDFPSAVERAMALWGREA